MAVAPQDRIIYPNLGITAHARLWGVSRQRAHQILDRPAQQARGAVSKALRIGTMVRPKVCSRCHKGRRAIEAHHPDYTKRYDVQWLCVNCHGIVHPHHPFARNANPNPPQKQYCSDCGDAIYSTNKSGRCIPCRVKQDSVTKVCAKCGAEFTFTATQHYQRLHGRKMRDIAHDRWYCSSSHSSLHSIERGRQFPPKPSPLAGRPTRPTSMRWPTRRAD